MTTPWIAAFLVLSGLVVVLGVLVLGMLRRVTPLIERSEEVLAHAARRVSIGGLPAGAHVPPFAVRQLTGDTFTERDLRGEAVMLFLSSNCKACETFVADLTHEQAPALAAPLIVVSDVTPEAKALARSSDVTVLVDEDKSLAAALDNRVAPQAFVLIDGRVRASGTPNSWKDMSDLLASTGGDRQTDAAAASVAS